MNLLKVITMMAPMILTSEAFANSCVAMTGSWKGQCSSQLREIEGSDFGPIPEPFVTNELLQIQQPLVGSRHCDMFIIEDRVYFPDGYRTTTTRSNDKKLVQETSEFAQIKDDGSLFIESEGNTKIGEYGEAFKAQEQFHLENGKLFHQTITHVTGKEFIKHCQYSLQ